MAVLKSIHIVTIRARQQLLIISTNLKETVYLISPIDRDFTINTVVVKDTSLKYAKPSERLLFILIKVDGNIEIILLQL